MEKTLVVLLGNARGGEKTWQTMYENLLTPYEADLALLFGKTKTKNNSLYDKAKYVWELEEYKDWADYYKKHCSGCWFKFFNHFKNYGTGGGIENFIGSGAIIFAFRHYLKNFCGQYLQNYDRIILTRSDFFYLSKHPILPNNKFYTPEGEDYDGVTDRHHIFPASVYPEALGIIEYISDCNVCEQLITSGLPLNPERLLLKYYEHNGINRYLQKCKRVQFTVATETDLTRWQPRQGLVQGHTDLYIKYSAEYDMAKQNQLLESSN